MVARSRALRVVRAIARNGQTALGARRRRVRGASGKVFVLEKKIPTSFRRNYVFAGMNGMHVSLFPRSFLRRSSTI